MSATVGTPIIGAYLTPANTSTSATITSPAATDFYVALLTLSSTTSAAPSISGVTGMTWTNIGDVVAGIGRCVAWIGTGGTATGTATASWGAQNRNGQLRIIPITGATALAVAVALAATGSSSLAVGATLDGPSQTPAVDDIVIEFGRNSSASDLVAYSFTPSGWTVHGNTTSTDTVASAHKVAASTAAHKVTATNNHASARSLIIAQVVLRPTVATNTTTVALPVTAGLSAAATTVAKSSVALAVNAGLSLTAKTVARSNVALPTTATLAFAAESFESGESNVDLPVAVGLTFAAASVAKSTTNLPATVATSFAASVVASSTVELPASAGLTFSASIPVDDGATTVALPVSAGLYFAASGGDKRPPRWTEDLSQTALVNVTTVGGPVMVVPALAEAPEGVPERPLMRQSHIMPALTADINGRVRRDADYPIIEEVVGVPHIFINNRDVTYFRDAPVTFGEWTSSQPEGDESASIDFPQLTPVDEAGVGELAWLKHDAPVEIVIVTPEGVRLQQFSGHLVSDNTGSSDSAISSGWHVEGTLAQGAYVGHRVPSVLAPTDIGTLIAKDYNSVVSRRYAAFKKVTTGIKSTQRGSDSDSVNDYAQALLGTAWTSDARQWTIKRTSKPRAYAIGLKDRTTPHWTVTFGAPGIATDLTRDSTEVVNAIYGRGVGTNGYSWAGWCFPGLRKDDAPAYPYASPGTVISIGDTDAGTLTGRGITDWQERARELGYRISTDGVYSSSDAETCREIQERYGLLIDGIVGPQTWAATFAVGSNAGSLSGAYRRPLAISSSVDPHLYTADGDVKGINPNYLRSVIRRERWIDYGPGVTKAQATADARRELARDSVPGWTGTITLTTDPHEGDKWQMFEGQNVRVLGWRGATLMVHIVSVSKNLREGTVTLTVDSKARDAMTLSAIMVRDRDSKVDPSRRPGNVNRRSRQAHDTVVEFDGESGAGVIPRHALYGGLWTVIRIPVSQVGRLAKVDVRTSGSPSRYALALFGAPIQPSHLHRYIGNPLASSSPWDDNADLLIDKFGFIEGWGTEGSACGYGYGSEGSSPLTGRLIDEGGAEYVSQRSPWVWVAEYAASSCFISGRLYPAPVT